MPSSVIRTFGYSAARCELRVTFQSGKRYVYLGVPLETYTAMRHAFSKGEFFNANIRDHFQFIQVEESRVASPKNERRAAAVPKQPTGADAHATGKELK
jgi:KTSC domain